MSSESEAFSLSVCLDASRFSLLSIFTLIQTICPRLWQKPPSKNARSPLPLDVRRSKTSDVALTGVTSFENSLKKYWLILAKMRIYVLLKQNISASLVPWSPFT